MEFASNEVESDRDVSTVHRPGGSPFGGMFTVMGTRGCYWWEI
jgi:hypothetical protein